jgi:DNA-binding transcriptional ArsR family regulator
MALYSSREVRRDAHRFAGRRAELDEQGRHLLLYRQLLSLEIAYGMDRLEKEERLLFGYLVREMAGGRILSIPDLVASGITSRASTYRHLKNLREAGLIEFSGQGRLATIQFAPRFRTFLERFDKLARARI